MVKKFMMILILTLIFLLLCGGCAESSGASAGKIIPPSNQACPLGGRWTVLQELGPGENTDLSENAEDAEQKWVGTDVQINADAIALGDQVWNHLSYKIKKVDAADYLMTRYVSFNDISLPESQAVDVITVYAASNFLGEFMKIDDESMISFIQDKALLMNKISDQTDIALGEADTKEQDRNLTGTEGTSGILLGLKIPSNGGYTYQTLWIAADHQQLRPVLASEQLFFPRTSGFWALRVKAADSGTVGNMLEVRNVAEKVPGIKEKDNDLPVRDDIATRTINYIGNNYVAIEKQADGVSQLQVLPVDNLSSPEEIKVSDLLGEEGSSIYQGAREHAASELRKKGFTSIIRDEAGENFGLVRKNGHWFLIGRINYLNGEKHEDFNFDLKIIPPSSLIFYDTLMLSWHSIKDRVPDALDAFTSPNKDIAMIKTKNKLLIYRIAAEQLAENPLAEVDLREGTTVIMDEWATGSYVDSWEKSFLSYGAQPLSGSTFRIR